jgi:hypothetical protein
MGLKRFNSCCGCYSLKSGSVIAGVLGILLSIVTIVVILTTRIDFKTVVSWTAKINFNLLELIVGLILAFWRLHLSLGRENHLNHQSLYGNHLVITCNHRSPYCEINQRQSIKTFNEILILIISSATTICFFHGSFLVFCSVLGC